MVRIFNSKECITKTQYIAGFSVGGSFVQTVILYTAKQSYGFLPKETFY